MPARLLALMLLLTTVLLAGCSNNSEQASAEKNVRSIVAVEQTFEISLTIEAENNHHARVVVIAEVSGAGNWISQDNLEDADFCRRVLSLFLAEGDETKDSTSDRVPILGKYWWDGGRLHFRPAFALDAGERYVARFDIAAADARFANLQPIERAYQVPSDDRGEPPQITAVYPSGNVVPANHLKFYLVFSEPMQQGDIFSHFRLVDETESREVGEPFRLTELWSRDGRRLTLWFHPGRQKDGVNLNVELGPILSPGREYRLTVSGQWTSAAGVPLGKDAEKRFSAGPVDREQPAPERWEISAPGGNTLDPVICRFGEPLDWALVQSEIHVETAAGELVAGKLQVGAGEASISFTPQSPWQSGPYRLAIGSVIEDLAGNSIERPFERDLDNKQAESVGRVAYRGFEVAGD